MYRPVQFIIQPIVVEDDGVSLTPVPVEQITVAAVDIHTFAERFLSELDIMNGPPVASGEAGETAG